MVVGLGVPGINGEAMAPFSDAGQVGSLNEFLQVSFTGDPQRAWFCAKADSGKPDKDFGISSEKWLPETLKSWRFWRFKPEMEPVNRFSLSRRVRR